MIATLSALVLGLLIASAQSALQTQSNQIRQMTANVILLDNMLARSGADAQPVRALLRSGVQGLVDRIWREQDDASTKAAPFEATVQTDLFFDRLLKLTPHNDTERITQTKAIQLEIDLAQTRGPFCAIILFHPKTVRMRTCFLVDGHLRQLRVVCAPELDHRGDAVPLCAVSINRNLSHSRVEPSLYWSHGNLERTVAQHVGAIGSVGQRAPRL